MITFKRETNELEKLVIAQYNLWLAFTAIEDHRLDLRYRRAYHFFSAANLI